VHSSFIDQQPIMSIISFIIRFVSILCRPPARQLLCATYSSQLNSFYNTHTCHTINYDDNHICSARTEMEGNKNAIQ